MNVYALLSLWHIVLITATSILGNKLFETCLEKFSAMMLRGKQKSISIVLLVDICLLASSFLFFPLSLSMFLPLSFSGVVFYLSFGEFKVRLLWIKSEQQLLPLPLLLLADASAAAGETGAVVVIVAAINSKSSINRLLAVYVNLLMSSNRVEHRQPVIFMRYKMKSWQLISHRSNELVI